MLDDDRTSPEALARTWDTTTDAIAARIAVLLGADELALLKSTSVPPGTTRDEAVRLGLVDAAFPSASRGLNAVVAVNLRDDDPSSERSTSTLA